MGFAGICLYTVATGFVAGGMLASLYQLVTADPLRFELMRDRGMSLLLLLPALVFAGPAIIMRNALRARMAEGRDIHWLAFSTALCALWSFCSGLFILNLVIAIQAGSV